MNTRTLWYLFVVIISSALLGSSDRNVNVRSSSPTAAQTQTASNAPLVFVDLKAGTVDTRTIAPAVPAVQSASLHIDQVNDEIRQADIGHIGSRYVYFVQGPNIDGQAGAWDYKKIAQVIQLDITTGQGTVLYQQAGLQYIFVSPNEKFAVVVGTAIDPIRKYPVISCILDISARQCHPLQAPFNLFYTIGWIDNTRFFYSNGVRLVIGNATSLQAGVLLDRAQIKGGFETIVLIPGTHILLFNSYTTALASYKLIEFNVDSQQLTMLPFDSSANTGSTFTEPQGLDISPDGHYISYAASQVVTSTDRPQKWLIVDLHTGHLVASGDGPMAPEWEADSQHYIGYRQPSAQDFTVVQFDLAGNMTPLPNSSGYLIIRR